jgi:hypothetical protein
MKLRDFPFSSAAAYQSIRTTAIALAGALLLAACTGDPLKPVTVHLVSEFTMADRPDPSRNPERGWGQLFPEYLHDLGTEEHTTPRVLVVVGGHSYDTTEFYDMLGSLEEFHFDSISHPDAHRLLASEHIYSYDAIMYYDFITNMPLEDSAIYLNLARRGMPMLFLHHAICTFQQWDGYAELVGGKYIVEGFGNDPSELSDYRHDLDLTISVLDKQHPVTRGMEDFTIHDEGYSNLWIRDGIVPLLGTNHPDCSDTVGWVNRFDRSTVVYLIFGHDSQAYANRSFRQLLANSLGWLAAG